uniref:Putative secreted protein n=1 Tax=Anopheles darlingi TaxID=43151 RepID=A0A2M4DAC8_ANODA
MLLADAVGSIFGLIVHLWVVVHVVKDDRIRSEEIDAQSTGPGAQQKHESIRLRTIEIINLFLAIRKVTRSIEHTVIVAPPVQIIRQNLQHRHELRKDQDARAALEQLGQQSIEHDHLGAVAHDFRRDQ